MTILADSVVRNQQAAFDALARAIAAQNRELVITNRRIDVIIEQLEALLRIDPAELDAAVERHPAGSRRRVTR